MTLAITEAEPTHQGPDGRLLLQAGDAGERRAGDGAALHLRRRADRGRHRRSRLRPARRVALPMARSAILNVMVAAATKAARGLNRDFGEVENLQVSRKGPADFVSAADHRAEEVIRAELATRAAELRLPHGGIRRDRPAAIRSTAGSSIRSTAPPISCTAFRNSPSRSRSSGRESCTPRWSTIRSPTSSSPPSAAAARS